MIDLTTIPFEDLKAEFERRKAIAKAARKKASEEKVCCRNCAYRFSGYTNNGRIQGTHTTWVCFKRPKITRFNYLDHPPVYNDTYHVCKVAYDGCEMFVHRRSAEGKKIQRKLMPMTEKFD